MYISVCIVTYSHNYIPTEIHNLFYKEILYNLPYVANNQVEGVSDPHTQGEGAKLLKAT